MRNALIRNSAVAIIWWIIFYPGFFSSDSFGAVNMAKSGELTNAYTASWAIYVRVFSFFGNFIGFLTLLNVLILVYSVTRFSFEILSIKRAAVISFLITLTPMVSGMGITLWHDILMTAGLLLIVTLFTKILKNSLCTKEDIFSLLIPGAILVSFRPNGLPTLLVFSVLILLFGNRKTLVRPISSTLAISAGTTIIASLVILGASPINSYYAQEWMRNDISCYASTEKGATWLGQNLKGIGDSSSWASKEACTFLNRYSLNQVDRQKSLKVVPTVWKNLLLSDPIFIAKTHFNRNYYVIPFPINGLPSIPFLHSTIEIADAGIIWAFPSLAEKARIIMRAANALRPILAYAGLWLTIIFVLMISLKSKEFFPTFLMGISLLFILFVFAPIPDGRYSLFVLIAGQIIFLDFLIKETFKFRNRISL